MLKRSLKYIEWESLPSTNSFCKENSSFFDPKALTVVQADIQTEGRGTNGREWVFVGKNNLYVSYVFFLDKEKKNINTLSTLLAESILEALKSFDFEAVLKWPNDIYSNNKKLGGILTEISTEEEHFFCVAGFGLNVNASLQDLAPLEGKATSLKEESGKTWDLSLLLPVITNTFLDRLTKQYS